MKSFKNYSSTINTPQFPIAQVLAEGTRGISHTTPDGTLVVLYELGIYNVFVWMKGQTATVVEVKVATGTD